MVLNCTYYSTQVSTLSWPHSSHLSQTVISVAINKGPTTPTVIKSDASVLDVKKGFVLMKCGTYAEAPIVVCHSRIRSINILKCTSNLAESTNFSEQTEQTNVRVVVNDVNPGTDKFFQYIFLTPSKAEGKTPLILFPHGLYSA